MYQDFFNKNDDYLSEFKQKVAEQKNATLEERRAELAHSRNSFLGTVAGIVLAGVVGWFVLAPQYQQQNKEIPVIRRPQTAIKIKPENPGGMEIPNQDKNVYNIVEKKEIDNTVVENLLPTPEQPKLPDIVPEETDIEESREELDEMVADVAADKPVQLKENAKSLSDVVLNKPEDLLADTHKNDAVKQKVQETKPKNEPAPQPKTVAEKKVPVATNGNWQIQLVASKNKSAVESTWKTLSSKYTLLQEYSHEVQSADLGSQGIIYKLRAGSFASKEDAAAVCAALKTEGLNDCIAKER